MIVAEIREGLDMNMQERIEALEAEFNERLKALKAEVRQEFPQDGDNYYYIEPNGRFNWIYWSESNYDLQKQALGNVFQTEEQAEFAVEKLKVEAELRKFSRPFKCGEINRYIFLDTNGEFLDVVGVCYSQYQGTIYFESDEKAHDAIESVGEDRIKKYIFGVED